MGLIYGDYGGRSDEFAPGGFSFENGFCPHGGMSLLFELGIAMARCRSWLVHVQSRMMNSRKPRRPNSHP